MSINMEIELGELISSSVVNFVSDEAMPGLVKNITNAAFNHWRGLAQKQLHGSRADYVKGLQTPKFSGNMGIITLQGAFPNLIEHGGGGGDMRDWLLGANVPETPVGQKGKHRNAAGGFYRAIPFRHQTPGTSGSAGAPMGNPYSKSFKDAKKMGRKVYAAAKGLEATTMKGGRAVTPKGGRLPPGLVPKLKKIHSADIYAGMIKASGAYAKAIGSQYATFRTISTTSGTDKWIRPNSSARNFAQQTDAFVRKLAPKVFEQYIKGALESAR